jgi:predicted permease
LNQYDTSIAATVFGVFLVMAVGAFSRYLKWLTSEVDRYLAAFLANVLLPSFFFHRILTDKNDVNTLAAWTPAFFGFGMTAMGFVVASLIAFTIGKWFGLIDGSSKRSFALSAGICNYGYIPIPIAEIFFPTCLVTLLVHNAGVDLALWSIGLFIISGKGLKGSWRRMIFSPPLISVAVGLLIRQSGFNVYLPRPAIQMTEQLGRCSIPMGLVLSGAIVFDCVKALNLKRVWRSFILGMLVRVLLLPIVFLAIAKYAASSKELQEVLLLQASMPAATFPIVMTRLFNQDVETACTVIVGTSLMGIITIPVWIMIGSSWLGFS